jgi:predicted nucleotidyltransferase
MCPNDSKSQSNDSDSSSNGEDSARVEKHKEREIDWLFGSGTRVDVLWCYMRYPDEFLGSRDLERLTGRTQSDCRRNANLLYLTGLLKAKIIRGIGGVSHEQPVSAARKPYCLNKKHPWVPALRMLLERSVGSLQVLEEGLQNLTGIEVAFVFGSFAQAEQLSDSDLDLAVIGSQTLKTLAKPIAQIESRIGREIHVIVHSAETWRKKFDERNHFVHSLTFKPKVFMVGDDERLERITSGPTDQTRAGID